MFTEGTTMQAISVLGEKRLIGWFSSTKSVERDASTVQVDFGARESVNPARMCRTSPDAESHCVFLFVASRFFVVTMTSLFLPSIIVSGNLSQRRRSASLTILRGNHDQR